MRSAATGLGVLVGRRLDRVVRFGLLVLVACCGMEGVEAQIRITELHATNASGLVDEDGEFSDWIELFNPGVSVVNLTGWSLTDDATDLTRWEVPPVALGPGEYRVIFCSGKDRSNPGFPLHTNFKLNADGEYLGLVRDDGVVEHSFAPAYPEQVVDYSYGLEFASGDPQLTSFLYFDAPSPGGPNVGGATGFASPPSFSQPSQTYFGNLAVEIFGVGPVTLRYTTDGSRPEAGDPTYTTPLVFDSSITLTARSFAVGLHPSREVQVTLVALDDDLQGFTSDAPLIFLDTDGAQIFSGSFTDTRFAIHPAEGMQRATAGAAAEHGGTGGLKQRGSSSSGFPKKQWAFEIWDAFGQDLDVPLLGFSKESDWILNGPYSDKSLMRNALSYQWSRNAGRWAPRTKFVEVFLNTGGGKITASDYVGVYVFMEKIKRGSDRVDIEEIEPGDDALPELSGGYLFKKDRLDPGDVGFSVPGSGALAYVDPKEDEVTPEQAAYLEQLLIDLTSAVNGPNPSDPTTGYPSLIDVDAWVDHHWVVELTKNIDGFRLSSFFHKDRGGKLLAGPVWDYNLSLGNADYLQGWIAEGWYADLLSGQDYPWWGALFDDPDFKQRSIDRWLELRRGPWSNANLLADIEAMRQELDEAQGRNFQRWNILGSYVWPNWFIADTWPEEIDFLSGFVVDRLAWIDSQSLTPPAFSVSPGIVSDGTVVSLDAPGSLTVYYTTNGIDPREAGGAISPSAIGVTSTGIQTTVIPAPAPVVRARVATSGTLGDTWRDLSFDDASWMSASGIGVGYDQQPTYDPLIDLEVGPEMDGIATGVYVRYSFWIDDPALLTAAQLNVQYDDGFSAWINGVPAASDRDPVPLLWDSVATSSRPDLEALGPVAFAVPPAALSALNPGWNVLAVHGLNVGPSSSDFLFRAELVISQPSASGIEIVDPVYLRARSHDGTEWSGLTEGFYTTASVGFPVRVSEIMYHPADDTTGAGFDDDEFEFIELVNTSTHTVYLNGLRFTDGIEFDYSADQLSGAPGFLSGGERLVLVKNPAAFEARYGSSIGIAGQYSGSLSNGGETLQLQYAGEEVLTFTYDDGWHPETDGSGASLVAIDLLAADPWWSTSLQWEASAPGGTPGEGAGIVAFRRPGDLNADGQFNVADVTRLLAYLFGLPDGDLPCGGAIAVQADVLLGDLNADGGLDLADGLFMLAALFQGGPPPVIGYECVEVPSCAPLCP